VQLGDQERDVKSKFVVVVVVFVVVVVVVETAVERTRCTKFQGS
jgi:hypothetical protein